MLLSCVIFIHSKSTQNKSLYKCWLFKTFNRNCVFNTDSTYVPQARNYVFENKFSRVDFLANCYKQFSPRMCTRRFRTLSRSTKKDQRMLISFRGWGGGIRTPECRHQKPVPYHLATPQRLPYCIFIGLKIQYTDQMAKTSSQHEHTIAEGIETIFFMYSVGIDF